MKYVSILVIASAAICFTACAEAHSSNNSKKALTVAEPEISVPKDTVIKKDTPVTEKKIVSRFDEISAILGGINDSGNTLSHLYDSSAWKENREFMNTSWKRLENSRLAKLDSWSKAELAGPNKNCNVVFYPFSGPDFLTANAFFPKAKKIVMLGLEPIGSLPEISKFNNLEAKDYSEDFKHSLNDIFQRSYFITQYMLRDFQKQKVNGLLPVLCFFIKKTGHKITDIRYLVKKGNDTIVENEYNTRASYFGVKVSCEKDSIRKEVYYFRYDVSNKQFNDTCVFYKFINANSKDAVTYVKSASYLLHANFMTNMKKLILRNSLYVLEDDTGIPYDDIDKEKKYDIKLYGRYVKPIKDFPYLRMQTSIVKAFEKDSASIPNLPFHLGYHWQSKQDLLILASRKNLK